MIHSPIAPFLKWAGRKDKLAATIIGSLPAAKRLIEPFVGSGAVFLNSTYKKFLLADSNQDLINLYITLQEQQEEFISYAKSFFSAKNNDEKIYYKNRERFNQSTDSRERSALFIYLNRHGYNGLCRYNSSALFNVPFGRHKTIGFPDVALRNFCEKAKDAKFICADFSVIMKSAKLGDVVYCDPPYVPLSFTANFTSYSTEAFGMKQQQQLATLAKDLAARGIPVLISNHNTPYTRDIYQPAKISEFSVRRSISCKSDGRQTQAQELLALFD